MSWKVPSRKLTELVAWEHDEIGRLVFASYTPRGIVLVTAFPYENSTKCDVVLNGVKYVRWYDTTAATTRMAALLVNRFFGDIGVPA